MPAPLFVGLSHTILRKLPKYAGAAEKALAKALWSRYWRLGLVAMFIATVVAGAIVIATIGWLRLSASTQKEWRSLAEAVLVTWLLVVIIIGMLRPKRGR